MQGIKSRNLFYYWILFLVSPFFAFVLVLRRGFNTYYQPIILAFAFLYGYQVYLFSGDIINFAETYEIVKTYTWNDFWYLLFNRLDLEALALYPANSVNRKPDIFAFVLQFLTSRFFDSPRVFWGLVSLIYTKFMLMFFNRVYQLIGLKPKGLLHYIFIVFLIVIVPFYVGVTGVRFWIALFLFVYFLMRYVEGRKLIFIFCSALSILIHYSYFVPVLMLLLLHFLPFKIFAAKLLVIFSLAVFMVSSTTSILDSFEEAAEITEGTTVGASAESYTNEDILAQRRTSASKTNWYVSFKADSIFYILMFCAFFEIFGFMKLRESNFSYKLFPFIMIFFCYTLITKNLGSLGRFQYIFFLLALARYVIIFPLNVHSRYLRFLSFILLPTLLIYITVSLRAGLYTVESYFPIHNSLSVFFLRASESLSEFIVGH